MVKDSKKKERMKLLTDCTILLSLILACSNPTEPELPLTEFPELPPRQFTDYLVTYNVGAAFNDKGYGWNAFALGIFIYLGEDTLKNVSMRFTLKNVRRDTVLAESVGYFTHERVQFKYFPEYPYKKEMNLVPNEEYYFYAVTDTMYYLIGDVTAWITPIAYLNNPSPSVEIESEIQYIKVHFSLSEKV